MKKWFLLLVMLLFWGENTLLTASCDIPADVPPLSAGEVYPLALSFKNQTEAQMTLPPQPMVGVAWWALDSDRGAAGQLLQLSPRWPGGARQCYWFMSLQC